MIGFFSFVVSLTNSWKTEKKIFSWKSIFLPWSRIFKSFYTTQLTLLVWTCRTSSVPSSSSQGISPVGSFIKFNIDCRKLKKLDKCWDKHKIKNEGCFSLTFLLKVQKQHIKQYHDQINDFTHLNCVLPIIIFVKIPISVKRETFNLY